MEHRFIAVKAHAKLIVEEFERDVLAPKEAYRAASDEETAETRGSGSSEA